MDLCLVRVRPDLIERSLPWPWSIVRFAVFDLALRFHLSPADRGTVSAVVSCSFSAAVSPNSADGSASVFSGRPCEPVPPFLLAVFCLILSLRRCATRIACMVVVAGWNADIPKRRRSVDTSVPGIEFDQEVSSEESSRHDCATDLLPSSDPVRFAAKLSNNTEP